MAEIVRAGEAFRHGLFQGASCAFGVFDGVHLGHQFLIACAKASAQESSGRSIALTFDIDPDEKFHPDRLQKLMTNEDRLATLAESGVDAVVALPFTDRLAAYGPLEFLEKAFGGGAPESLHVGSGFRFGAKAQGTVQDLEAWGSQSGTLVCAHALESIDGAPVTSTRIRLLLNDTEVEKANGLLGRPYYVRGDVVPGRGQGGRLGFKTANLRIDHPAQPLGDGVYGALATLEGRRYKAAVSMGVPPMFEGLTTATCEAHILDYSGDLYGKALKIEFLHYLRPMMRFESQQQLTEAVLSNIAWVRDNVTLPEGTA